MVTLVKVWGKTRNSCGNTRLPLVFHSFSDVPPNLYSCFHKFYLWKRGKGFLFRKYNNSIITKPITPVNEINQKSKNEYVANDRLTEGLSFRQKRRTLTLINQSTIHIFYPK